MTKICITGIEIERSVHIITEEQYDTFKELRENMGQQKLNYRIKYDEGLLDNMWYEGYDHTCAICLDQKPLSISVEYDNIRQELPIDSCNIDCKTYDLTSILGDSSYEEGDFVLIAQHLSRNTYYFTIDGAFEPSKLTFVTRKYSGQFMMNSNTIDYIGYDGVMLDLECDGISYSKYFNVDMYHLDDVLQKG